MVTAHDPLCPAPGSTLSGCLCADLRKRDARVRADERERIAKDVRALWAEECCGYHNPIECASCRAYDDVLTYAIARGGDQ